MIDTHCHLWMSHFKGEVPDVIDRANKAGVHTLICVGCDEESSRQSAELSKQYESVYAAIGIHPTETGSLGALGSLGLLGKLRKMLESNNPNNPFLIVAIGEIGLDYFHEPCDSKLQKQMFREQCLLAQEFNLPVVVHLRSGKAAKIASEHFTQAEKDCLEVLDEVGAKSMKVLFHCFSSDRKFADEALSRGFYLSFSGIVTYPNAKELREVAKACPLNRMMVETDCPFLTPQSHRGKRNEPAFVVEIAKKIAELKNISFEELEKFTDQNVRIFFGLR